jgi:phage gp29-like protein
MVAQVQKMAAPQTVELVKQEILRFTGLNAQAFSGGFNPSEVYEMMVLNHPRVYRFYREMEAKDTAISSSMDMRRLLTMARRGTVAPADADNGQAREYADSADAFLKSIPRLNFAKWELLDAPAYGFSVCEIMWNSDGGRVWVDKIIGRPQELFRFNKITFPQTGDLLLAQMVGGEGFPVPQNKFLVASYHPRHGDRRGLPVLRDLFWASWFKRQLLRLHLHFAEKGQGTVAVQYPASADPFEQKKALEGAMAIATELAVAVPDTFQVMEKLLTTTRTRSVEDFKTFVDYQDAECARRILGQTLTSHGSENGRGSQALGVIHEEMMYEIIRNDAQDVEDVFNDQLVAPYLLFTFGPQALEEQFRPRYVIEKDPPKDAQAALSLIQSANNLVDVLESEVYAAAQCAAPGPNDKVVKRPVAPGAIDFQPAGL